MIATALEQNGAERVYIIGRRKEILENAVKQHSVRNAFLFTLGSYR